MAFSCKSAVCRDRHSTFENTKKPLLSAIFGSSSSFCLLAIFILPFLLFSSESASAATISPITGEETEMRHQQQNHPRRQQNNDDEDDGRAVGTGRKCEIKVHIVSFNWNYLKEDFWRGKEVYLTLNKKKIISDFLR